jgi:hypothetical protein
MLMDFTKESHLCNRCSNERKIWIRSPAPGSAIGNCSTFDFEIDAKFVLCLLLRKKKSLPY